MALTTDLVQIAGYGPATLKQKLVRMVECNPRLSLSSLVVEGMEIAMAELDKRYPTPAHDGHRRKKTAA